MPPSVDVVYRPYQVTSLADLDVLERVAERFVVNQLDTIAFENPAYFASDERWLAYRDATRLALELAHGVAFLSEAGRRATHAQGLLSGRAAEAVVGCGVDGAPGTEDGPEAAPAGLGPGDEGFLLCLGASYLHKNRPFAVEVWTELRRRGWEGRLVLAGPTPPHGNSLAREAELRLAMAEDVRADLVTLGTVSEDEKRWLYRHAALVLYPSSVEGFGLVPFEAARFGVPTLSTRGAGLDEVLPPGLTVLDGFDVARGADAAWGLLHDRVAAKELVEALRVEAESRPWDATALYLVALFGQALRRPRGRVLGVEGEGEEPLGVAPRTPRRRPPRSGRRRWSAWCTRSSTGPPSSSACRPTAPAASTRPGWSSGAPAGASSDGQIRVRSCSHTGRVMLRRGQRIRHIVVGTQEERSTHGST